MRQVDTTNMEVISFFFLHINIRIDFQYGIHYRVIRFRISV